jgi:hypothetical protein
MEMRGDGRVQDGMFSYVSLAQRAPQDHPPPLEHYRGSPIGVERGRCGQEAFFSRKRPTARPENSIEIGEPP